MQFLHLSSLAEVRPLQLLVQSKFLLHSVLDDSASPLLSTSGTLKTLRAVSYFWDHKCHFTFLFKSDYCGSNSQLTFNLFCLDVTINLNIPYIFWCLCIYFVCNQLLSYLFQLQLFYCSYFQFLLLLKKIFFFKNCLFLSMIYYYSGLYVNQSIDFLCILLNPQTIFLIYFNLLINYSYII